MRGARFAFFPHGCATTVRITKHLGFPQCRIAFRPCNAYITNPYVDTHQWRCGPEAVNHRRHPAIAEVMIIWRISGLALHPIGSRVSSTSVPSSTRHQKRCRVSRGKETMKDVFKSRQEAASAITGGK
ncbi:hypothetical protein TcG_05324 [Trypanosoma cruzi]|nr:hypothetical protein TcG_05324 [Trypanosoma cruzi]